MTDTTTTINDIKTKIKTFVEARDWNQFHDPKNVSMLIATEAAELLEIFRWVESSQADKLAEEKRLEVEHEAADVLFGVLLLCNRCNIDISKALEEKMKVNAKRYPAEKIKGKALKYTEI